MKKQKEFNLTLLTEAVRNVVSVHFATATTKTEQRELTSVVKELDAVVKDQQQKIQALATRSTGALSESIQASLTRTGWKGEPLCVAAYNLGRGYSSHYMLIVPNNANLKEVAEFLAPLQQLGYDTALSAGKDPKPFNMWFYDDQGKQHRTDSSGKKVFKVATERFKLCDDLKRRYNDVPNLTTISDATEGQHNFKIVIVYQGTDPLAVKKAMGTKITKGDKTITTSRKVFTYNDKGRAEYDEDGKKIHFGGKVFVNWGGSALPA